MKARRRSIACDAAAFLLAALAVFVSGLFLATLAPDSAFFTAPPSIEEAAR
jgi:hypothetical protein